MRLLNRKRAELRLRWLFQFYVNRTIHNYTITRALKFNETQNTFNYKLTNRLFTNMSSSVNTMIVIPRPHAQMTDTGNIAV
jgi:hypothetical protein